MSKTESDKAAKAAKKAAKEEKKKRKSIHSTEEKHTKKKKKTSSDSAKQEKFPVGTSPTSSSAESEQTKASTPPADPMSIENFNLSSPTKSLLRAKGIESLFPIQSQCLVPLLEGKDLVGRARTGCGKTLAFVLPIVESLGKDGQGRRPHGRNPSVVVLAPTRELAKQVAADFEHFAKAASLSTICLYGGTPYGPQEGALRRGIDVVIGTPGRVKDHLQRGTLVLKDLRFRVLDECDEMLNMGFVEDVETILTADVDADKVQTLLFSATLPKWVQEVKRKFLKQNHEVVDLVGADTMKASTSVQHMLLPSHWSQRSSLVSELVKCYGAGGRTIVFTETKKDANDLTQMLSEGAGARALHGDIAQSQREQTLQGFRSGKFNVLVATDVAARGLDIKNVELVIQVEPPKDPETYIHRSGRTGRAGSTGISITLVDRRKEGLIPFIQRKAGVTFTRIGAPQPTDVARIAAERAVESLKDVSDSAIAHFKDAALKFLEDANSPEEALAAALAKITGHKDMKPRSMLTAHDDCITLQFVNTFVIDKPGFVFSFLRRRISDEDKVNEVKRMTLTNDGMGAVFDVPVGLKDEFLESCQGEEGEARLIAPASLPELKPRPNDSGNAGWGNNNQSGGYGNRGGYQRGNGWNSGGNRGNSFGNRGGAGAGRGRGFGQGNRFQRR
eukprot:jgi/Picsp_1/3850/NSC_01362-R1_protein